MADHRPPHDADPGARRDATTSALSRAEGDRDAADEGDAASDVEHLAAVPKPTPSSSLRTGLATLLDATHVLDVAFAARRLVSLPFLPIVTYHRIGDPRRIASSFDEGVVDASAEAFDRQVALLARTFSLIGITELRAYLFERRPLPANPALITFDDGYRECFDVALPILQRHRARAVFFVATAAVGKRRVFWWDRISYLIKHATQARFAITYPAAREFDLRSGGEAVIGALLRIIKDTYALDLERFLTGVASACGTPWGDDEDRRFADALVMTWDHVRSMRRAGMDVQSHTRTHRILQTLRPAELDDELRGSREDLEAALDEPVHALAYPVGQSIHPDPGICAAVQAAGYDLGFSNATGTNVLRGPGRFNPLDVRRLAVEHGASDAYFRAAIAIPMLAHRRPLHVVKPVS